MVEILVEELTNSCISRWWKCAITGKRLTSFEGLAISEKAGIDMMDIDVCAGGAKSIKRTENGKKEKF